MSKKIHFQTTARRRSSALRLGFVPLVDCAPIVMAQELGLFEKYGLQVQLSRELGWASIRDKIIYGELDAAQAVAGMVFAAAWGIGSSACECLTGLVLNAQGNAITLSNRLWQEGVRDVVTLREALGRRDQKRPFVFGVVYPHSSHHFLLRQWLKSGGINPDRDVQIVVVPPPQMFSNLRAGNLDGYCVGEPWNSVAVQARAGWCPAISASLQAGHPEKVLMVRNEFAEARMEEHLALIAALLESCDWCQKESNHLELIKIISRAEYVNTSTKAIAASFKPAFDGGHEQFTSVRPFHLFFGDQLNTPTADKAAWILHQMRLCHSLDQLSASTAAMPTNLFRCDLYDVAFRLYLKKQRIPTPYEQSTLSIV